MNCLLDTHAFLWAVFSADKLSAQVRKVIRSPENRVCVSAVSFWEISLKYAIGKIGLEKCQPEDLPDVAAGMDIEILPLTAQEAATFHRLPRREHKDPFDRMIIWQAVQRSLVLVSKDGGFAGYEELGLQTLW
ncbi:MAG: type II toxin-antitoxin system VapC family toxin [Nevskiaceae bacterium]|jgi:PIN domain nuclease of toxin-antitoxin system|nr:type II toxin-antitoxin system VapC family toxin [Nevskiaceae bacterium]